MTTEQSAAQPEVSYGEFLYQGLHVLAQDLILRGNYPKSGVPQETQPLEIHRRESFGREFGCTTSSSTRQVSATEEPFEDPRRWLESGPRG